MIFDFLHQPQYAVHKRVHVRAWRQYINPAINHAFSVDLYH